MATSAIAGYKGVLTVSTSTGVGSEIAEIRNFNISVEHSEIDATSHDSSGDQSRRHDEPRGKRLSPRGSFSGDREGQEDCRSDRADRYVSRHADEHRPGR